MFFWKSVGDPIVIITGFVCVGVKVFRPVNFCFNALRKDILLNYRCLAFPISVNVAVLIVKAEVGIVVIELAAAG